jgi:hypothetical protein
MKIQEIEEKIRILKEKLRYEKSKKTLFEKYKPKIDL